MPQYNNKTAPPALENALSSVAYATDMITAFGDHPIVKYIFTGGVRASGIDLRGDLQFEALVESLKKAIAQVAATPLGKGRDGCAIAYHIITPIVKYINDDNTQVDKDLVEKVIRIATSNIRGLTGLDGAPIVMSSPYYKGKKCYGYVRKLSPLAFNFCLG